MSPMKSQTIYYLSILIISEIFFTLIYFFGLILFYVILYMNSVYDLFVT